MIAKKKSTKQNNKLKMEIRNANDTHLEMMINRISNNNGKKPTTTNHACRTTMNSHYGGSDDENLIVGIVVISTVGFCLSAN